MNLANLITLLRIALLPVIIFFIYQEKLLFSFLAILLFSVSVLSDYFDGAVARKRGEVTEVGSFLDPLSDKIVVTGLLLVFLVRGTFWLIPLAILIFRDFVVNGVRTIAARREIILSADIFGKLKTNAQFILIYSLMVKDFVIYDDLGSTWWMVAVDWIIYLFTVLAILLSLFSMGNYIYQFIKKTGFRLSGKEIKEGKLIILANRKSRGYRDAYRRRLLKKFAKRRKAKIIYLPKNKDMFQMINKKIKDKKHIIIAGGDGSFESALSYKPFWKKSLGFFPLGAGNYFYTYFYRGKRFEYLRSRFKFRETNLDVLELEWEKGKLQTTVVAIGVDSEVLRLIKTRTQNGLLDYLGGCWRAIVRGKADYDLQVNVDGKKINWDNCVNLTMGKVPYYGYNMRSMLGTINPNDGYVYGLGVVNTHAVFLNKALRVWSLVLISLGLRKSPIVTLKGKDIMIKSDFPFPIQAGGDFLGFSQWIKVRVVRKQKVLMI